MEIKLFEVRDRNTFMPVMAVKLGIRQGRRDGAELFLLRRAGYGLTQLMPTTQGMEPYVILCKLDGVEAQYDPFGWPNPRTLGTAHTHIIRNWSTLETGDVIDVEYILKETSTPKQSEREERLAR